MSGRLGPYLKREEEARKFVQAETVKEIKESDFLSSLKAAASKRAIPADYGITESPKPEAVEEEEDVLEDDDIDESEDEIDEEIEEAHDAEDEQPEEVKEQRVSRETAMILEAFERLIDKIDQLASNPPTVHVPAPIVEVTLPETRRTVSKIVERDENGLIKSVTESTVDNPEDDVLKESKSKGKK